MIIEWFRHIQTSMCKLCTSSVGPFVAVLVCVCVWLCVCVFGEMGSMSWTLRLWSLQNGNCRKLSNTKSLLNQLRWTNLEQGDDSFNLINLSSRSLLESSTPCFFSSYSNRISSHLPLHWQGASPSSMHLELAKEAWLTHIMLLLSQGTINNISSQE